MENSKLLAWKEFVRRNRDVFEQIARTPHKNDDED